MLRFLNQWSRGRGSWLLMAITTFGLEMNAILFYYVMELKPCLFCIYEHCALFGIIGAGLVGCVAPKTPLRYAAISIWLYSAWKGIVMSWEHAITQLRPTLFMSCDFVNPFPSWLPKLLVTSGGCSSVHQWEFLTLKMPQWLVGIFLAYFITALLVMIAQPFPLRKHDLFGR